MYHNKIFSKKVILIIVLLVMAIIAGIYYSQNKGGKTANDDTNISVNTKYTETYTHPTHNFSFNYPSNYTITSIPNDGGETILLQSTSTKTSVQIMLSPFQGDDIDVTSDIIKADIPDMNIENVNVVSVTNTRKGLSFTSDNSAFDGKSSEIWFVFKGILYQISTYSEFEDFLKDIFETWKFE